MKFESVPQTSLVESVLGAGPVLQIGALVLVGLFLLFGLWQLLRRRTRPCRWKKDRVRRRSGMQRWQCMACGVDAFTRDGRPPKECKRGLREVGL